MQLSLESKWLSFCIRTSEEYVMQQEERILPPAANFKIWKWLWSNKKGWRSLKTEFESSFKESYK